MYSKISIQSVVVGNSWKLFGFFLLKILLLLILFCSGYSSLNMYLCASFCSTSGLPFGRTMVSANCTVVSTCQHLREWLQPWKMAALSKLLSSRWDGLTKIHLKGMNYSKWDSAFWCSTHLQAWKFVIGARPFDLQQAIFSFEGTKKIFWSQMTRSASESIMSYISALCVTSKNKTQSWQCLCVSHFWYFCFSYTGFSFIRSDG